MQRGACLSTPSVLPSVSLMRCRWGPGSKAHKVFVPDTSLKFKDFILEMRTQRPGRSSHMSKVPADI